MTSTGSVSESARDITNTTVPGSTDAHLYGMCLSGVDADLHQSMMPVM